MDELTDNIELPRSVALVLYDFLSRFFDTYGSYEEAYIDVFEDQAEYAALSILLGSFEETLVEPFRPDYLQLLMAARDQVRWPDYD